MVVHYQAYLIRQKARYKGHVFFTVNQNPSFTGKTIVNSSDCLLLCQGYAISGPVLYHCSLYCLNHEYVHGTGNTIYFTAQCSEVTKWLLNRGETRKVTTVPRFWGLNGLWRTGIPPFQQRRLETILRLFMSTVSNFRLPFNHGGSILSNAVASHCQSPDSFLQWAIGKLRYAIQKVFKKSAFCQWDRLRLSACILEI